MEQFDLADTLAMVNNVRRAFGASQLNELPDARTSDSASCLYYRALSDVGCTGVGSTTITFDSERQASLVAELWGCRRDGNTITQPKQVSRVVSAFDNHDLKHYETSQYE